VARGFRQILQEKQKENLEEGKKEIQEEEEDEMTKYRIRWHFPSGRSSWDDRRFDSRKEAVRIARRETSGTLRGFSVGKVPGRKKK